MAQSEPTYILRLPRSVAMLCLTLVRKLPLEQVEQAHAILAGEIERAETGLRVAERERIANDVLAAREAPAQPERQKDGG